MSTDEHTASAGTAPGVGLAVPHPAATAEDEPAAPSWWHRSHPVFTPLAGFFTGLLVTVVVPTVLGATIYQVLGDSTATTVLPYLALLLLIPIALVVAPRTRRFGLYMLVGMLTTAVVVAGVGGATLWWLYSHDG